MKKECSSFTEKQKTLKQLLEQQFKAEAEIKNIQQQLDQFQTFYLRTSYRTGNYYMGWPICSYNQATQFLNRPLVKKSAKPYIQIEDHQKTISLSSIGSKPFQKVANLNYMANKQLMTNSRPKIDKRGKKSKSNIKQPKQQIKDSKKEPPSNKFVKIEEDQQKNINHKNKSKGRSKKDPKLNNIPHKINEELIQLQSQQKLDLQQKCEYFIVRKQEQLIQRQSSLSKRSIREFKSQENYQNIMNAPKNCMQQSKSLRDQQYQNRKSQQECSSIQNFSSSNSIKHEQVQKKSAMKNQNNQDFHPLNNGEFDKKNTFDATTTINGHIKKSNINQTSKKYEKTDAVKNKKQILFKYQYEQLSINNLIEP